MIIIGHTHGLEEAWLWVLVGHPHHSLHWLFIQMLTHMDFCTPCQIHQLNHIVVLYINNFLFCQLQLFFNMHFFTSKFKEETWLVISFVVSSILDFSCSWFMAKSTLQFASKSWTSFSYFVWYGDSCLSTLESTT